MIRVVYFCESITYHEANSDGGREAFLCELASVELHQERGLPNAAVSHQDCLQGTVRRNRASVRASKWNCVCMLIVQTPVTHALRLTGALFTVLLRSV